MNNIGREKSTGPESTVECMNNTGRDNISRSIAERMQSLPRFSDSAQRRVGGHIVSFAAILLVLTLIVRGTSAATLARVEISNPARNEIVEAVTGKANVTVCDTLDIFAPEGLTIDEMFVGQGQSVSVGDALARFDTDEVREKLTRESANLNKLLLDLEKLEREEAADTTSLDSAKRSLTRTQEDYTIVKAQGDADVAAAKEALDEVRAKQTEDPDAAAIDTALRTLQRTQEDYDAASAQGNTDILEAEEALNTAIKKQADSADSTAIDSAYRNLIRAHEDYNAAKAQSDKENAAALSAFETARDIAAAKFDEWENADDADKPAAHQAYLEAQADTDRALSAYETAKSRNTETLTNAWRRIEDAELSLQRAEQDHYKSSQQASDSRKSEIDKARDALETEKKRAEENLTGAARRVEDAEIALEKAEQDYIKSSDKATETLQDEIDKAQEAYTSALKRAEENLLSAARRIEDAEASVTKAGHDYGKSAQQTTDTVTQNSINAAALRLDIGKQKSIVDKLNVLVSCEGILYSDIGGIVASVKAGGITTNDKDALVAFMDGARGFEANLQIDKVDANKLTVGEACEVTTGGGSMYYTPTVTGIISSIAPPDDNDKVQITIRLPGDDWTEGQRVDVGVVQDRSVYDLCVPKSALRSDNTGYYLLIMEQKSSVLGVENTAVKVYVDIIVSDDDTAAVRGPIDKGSQIITGSNKSVAAGDRVRVSAK